MNRNTRKRKKEKKNVKTIKKKNKKNISKHRTKKRGKIVKKKIKQLGGLFFSKKCKKKQIEKKYKVVFVKNQIGGENNEKKLEIRPESCKMKIKDLEAQYNKYIEEWKKL